MKPDERPILMCRLECPAELLGMLDDWIPKHLDDSLAHPSVTSAGNYEIIRDFSSLPSALNHEGNRMVNYATNDLEGCLEWLDSQELRGAIEDGVDRESQYPPLDGEPFIGNIYVPGEVVGGSAEDFIRDGTWYVERFEVPVKTRWPGSRRGPQNRCTSSPRSREWRARLAPCPAPVTPQSESSLSTATGQKGTA